MKQTARFFILRFLRMLLLIAGVSVFAFALADLSPVDPLEANVGRTALGSMSREQIEKLEHYWGVGIPPMERFASWAKDFVKGDMGVSLLYRRGVAQILGEKLSNSMILMAAAWLLSGIFGFILGVLAGVYHGRAADRVIKAYSYLMASTPAFWVALLLLLVFGVWLKVLPIGFSVPIGVEMNEVAISERFRHAILPALALSVTGIANITLHTREKMIEVMESDYVLFARARGERLGKIVMRHGIRNVAAPALTLQFASISEIFGGSVLVEQVFSYPGMGQAAVTAGLGSDIPLLMAITVVSSLFVFGGNFIADLLYSALDPRIRKESQ